MTLQNLPTNSLHAGAHEQRFAYDDQEQRDLEDSITTDGIQVPLLVAPEGDGYLIIDGHRRRQAALTLALQEVPCDIRDDTAAKLKRAAFIVNFIRKDPSPIELAVHIAKTAADGEDSLEDIAHTLHRSVDWVKRQVAMLDWPEDVLQAIHRGQLSIAAAANLACVQEDTYRAYLLENAVQNGATARTTAAWLQAWRAAIPYETALEQPPTPGPDAPKPMVPQAPCIVCGQIFRTDELSHVPVCARDIQRIRQLDQR